MGVYTGENVNINIIYIVHVVKQELRGQFTQNKIKMASAAFSKLSLAKIFIDN